MNTTKQFFKKYISSALIILFLFFTINIILLFCIITFITNTSKISNISISEIANGIHIDHNQIVTIDNKSVDLIEKEKCWAMVLNDDGTVIWENSMPDNLPRHYTSSQIARFSRWYLDDYPVLEEVLSSGLLVIGYPQNSIIKLNYVSNSHIIKGLIYGSILFICINILVLSYFICRNIKRLEKAISPIINGIQNISQGTAIALPEEGELAEIETALNKTGTHLIEKERARAEWINAISHDIRTPLSIMLGYASEIEDDSLLPEYIQNQGELIRRQGEKLKNLIADLNLVSKLEYSMQPLKIETIYPIELIRQVIIEFLNTGLEDKYKINFDTDEDLNNCCLYGDLSLLRRMLQNIIQNSICHNPQGCNINVFLKKINQDLQIELSDNGIGLPDDKLTAFNKNFFMDITGTITSEVGHGFGIQIVYQIVKSHNGSIHLKKNSPHGLMVSILLPLSTEPSLN
ncbi:sensor histidine kinase [Clostridium oryzae]|uniref:histidine kinase n=1 Tax=Clostridium oryzae TaxID=1450648 RepID=A0A1V4IXW6_9CLOT|nr:HAMP domain-containing sensor histidine kinase [Clostridium oryzae]OPJ64615.1 alkaline phosphatase synthesis sensor protein PhoR [Clostridium oryzae]